jgi:hypothetical protein
MWFGMFYRFWCEFCRCYCTRQSRNLKSCMVLTYLQRAGMHAVAVLVPCAASDAMKRRKEADGQVTM